MVETGGVMGNLRVPHDFLQSLIIHAMEIFMDLQQRDASGNATVPPSNKCSTAATT
jgi:hypothetical protein